MSEERPGSMLSASRGFAVSVLLGGGSAVMAYELWNVRATSLGLAIALGAVMLVLLPRPIDVRSAVYAFFVPIAMTYGAVTGNQGILIIGAIAGAFFLFEKTAARRAKSPPGAGTA